MKKNPLKWMMIILIVLVVASIAINLFWNKKMNIATGEVGYFGIDDADDTKEETKKLTTTEG